MLYFPNNTEKILGNELRSDLVICIPKQISTEDYKFKSVYGLDLNKRLNIPN